MFAQFLLLVIYFMSFSSLRTRVPSSEVAGSIGSIEAGPALATEDNTHSVAANAAYDVDEIKPRHSEIPPIPPSLPQTEATPLELSVESVVVPEPPVSVVSLPPKEPSPIPPSSADPGIKQPVSDVRQPAEPVSADLASEIKEAKEQQDLASDPSLVNGLDQGVHAPIERPLTSDVTSSKDDPMQIDTLIQTDVQPAPEVPEPSDQEGKDKALPHHPAVAAPNEQLPDAPPIEVPASTALPSTEGLTTTAATNKPETESTDTKDPVPAQSKVSHPRDDEATETEPATKRVKSGSEGSSLPEFKVPDPPTQQPSAAQPVVSNATDLSSAMVDATPTSKQATASTPLAQNGKVSLLPVPAKRESNPDFDSPMTRPQHKHLQRGLTNLKKSNHADVFLAPVDFVALGIPNYPNVIQKPMDLRTMNTNLKEDKYATIADYVRDFDQMVTNTVVFNGPEHGVTQKAFHLRISFDRNLSQLPPLEYAEPSLAEKKAKKAVEPKPPPRRESRSSLGNAKSPTASSPQTTFALGPSGVPLIRRDSTIADGRPKREIHPPAPKDLPYSSSKPKRKKYQLELKFCEEVLAELKKPKYSAVSTPFLTPVDPVSLNIPNYHKIIKRPMDIYSIEKKLKTGQYENAKEFESDVKLMYQNCYKFNSSDHPVHVAGKEYEKIFDAKWSQKTKWLNDHAPSSEAQSPGSISESEEDDEEEEEEEEEEEDDKRDELAKLQESLIAISQKIDTITKRKKKSPTVAGKKTKGGKVTKKETKKARPKGSKKNGSKKGAKEKVPIMSYDEKRTISDRINELPENKVSQVLSIIRDNMPALKVSTCTCPSLLSHRQHTNDVIGRSR